MILGVGTDIIEIARIRQALEKKPNLTARLYTQREVDYCQRKKNPWQSFASRFAAKEAVSKAFGTGIGKIAWTDIEVVNDRSGKPQAVLYGAALALAEEKKIHCVHISLSHSEVYAIATAVLEGEV